MNAVAGVVHSIQSFLPPDLSVAYLRAVSVPVAQTIGMAAGGMLVAFAIGTPLAIVIGTRAPGYRAVVGALSAVRAVPDLTLAILAVVIVGLGPAAGIVALAVFYTAMVGKVFGDLFLAADPAPLEALRATGASRTAIAAFGLIPLTLADLLTFGSYAFECAMRASIIVGAVGGGGIGTELVGALNGFEYHRATTLILILVLLVAGIDSFGMLVRRVPRMATLLIPLGLWALWFDRPQILALGHALTTFGRMLPPQFRTGDLAGLPLLIAQTLAIAVGGTVLGALLALPSSLLAARRIVPTAVVLIFRRVLDLARAIPELVWGLILVVAVGVGPLAGALALGLHSGGVLGKLYAESFENVLRAPIEALEATGAARLPVVAFGFLPLALGPIAVHTLFRLDWNVRAAAIVGMIGAGGIGQALYDAQQLFFYREMLAYVVVTWVLVAAADWFGESLRRRLGWRFVAN
ncbi:MAG: phosphonate ABC transporter, permease protein PhnE [Vulcanimicrobiaceae bacterium]